MIDALISRLPPDALVLDVGCGTGRQALKLARAGFRVVAADLDFDAVATARELSAAEERPPRFLAARAESLPFPDGRFEAVLCADVLHWAPDADAFRTMWAESWRVLGRGGLFLVRALSRDALPSAVPVAGGPAGRFRLESGAEWFLPARADLDAALAAAGGIRVAPPAAEERAETRSEIRGSATMLARKPA